MYVHVYNRTTEACVAHHALEAKSFKHRAVGLIGKGQPQAIVFNTRLGIHTLGVKFPIDVLILDDLYRVVALKEMLRPNNIFAWNPRYHIVVELPPGTISRTNTKFGDHLEIKDTKLSGKK